MLQRLTNQAARPFGPLVKVIAIAVGLVLLTGVGYTVTRLLPGRCADGLERVEGECVGVTDGALKGVPEIEGLVQAVAEENAEVKRAWTDPENGKAPVPYVRVALMMPFTSDATSDMTPDQIRRSLAGAFAAQRRANASAGPHYQLLLAPDGKNLDLWEPVVGKLAGMTDEKAPLIGVFGMPSSTPDTKEAARALSGHRLPAIGPILTSNDMVAPYFFKTSPSNGSLTRALQKYLTANPGKGSGFLVADSREEDNYSKNLTNKFMDQFGKKYDLKRRTTYFVGWRGSDEDIPGRFSTPAQKLCVAGADTVFFAGRDRDLPGLVEQLAEEPSCDRSQPMRILKVGIGMDPRFTTSKFTRTLKNAGVTLVDAASVSPRWWAPGAERRAGLFEFLEQFEELRQDRELGLNEDRKPLDDGYAIMYHDAFWVLAEAFRQAYDDANEVDEKWEEGKEVVMPTKDDVYNTVIDMGIIGTDNGTGCVNCVQGASGTFGFNNFPDTKKWSVCKPVPVIEHPAASKKAGKVYHTHEEIFDGACP